VIRTYLGTGDVEKAISLQERYLGVLLAIPWMERISFDIGQHYFAKKEFQKAAALFRRFLIVYPGSEFQGWVHFMLAESLFNQKEYTAAIENYHQALEGKKRELEPQIFSNLDMPVSTSTDIRKPSRIGLGFSTSFRMLKRRTRCSTG